MSDRDVSRFVTLALDDAQLREQLKSDPDGAFKGFDLSAEERGAILSHDEHRLQASGLDPMTAHSWLAFHDAPAFAPDRPDAPGDLAPESP